MNSGIKHLYIIVPVFNEANNLPKLLENLDDWGATSAAILGVVPEVIVVDDGSTDSGTAVARAHRGVIPLDVLVHDVNRGPGAAFGTGFESLQSRLQDTDLVLTLEGDNTSRTDIATRMLVRIQEGYDVVLASPYAYGGQFANTSRWRLILSYLGTEFTRVAIGIHGIHTTSSFFRLYRGKTLNRLYTLFGARIIESPGFECMVELLFKIMLAGSSISEVEMLVDSLQRVGQSKMRIVRTIGGYLRVARSARRWRAHVEQSVTSGALQLRSGASSSTSA